MQLTKNNFFIWLYDITWGQVTKRTQYPTDLCTLFWRLIPSFLLFPIFIIPYFTIRGLTTLAGDPWEERRLFGFSGNLLFSIVYYIIMWIFYSIGELTFGALMGIPNPHIETFDITFLSIISFTSLGMIVIAVLLVMIWLIAYLMEKSLSHMEKSATSIKHMRNPHTFKISAFDVLKQRLRDYKNKTCTKIDVID